MIVNRHTPLKHKLVLIFVPIFTITVVFLSMNFYYKSKQAIINRAYSQLIAVRTIKERQLENYFDVLINEVQHRIIKRNENYTISNNCYDKIAKKEFLIKFPTIKIDTIADFSISDYHLNHNFMTYQIILALKGYDSLIVIKPDIKAINRIMLETLPESGFGKSGETYIVNKEGYFRSDSRFIDSVMNKEIKVNTGVIIKNLKSGKSYTKTKDYRDVVVLSSYNYFNYGKIKWLILSEIDYSEIMHPIEELGFHTLFVSTSIIVLIFITSLIVAGYITKPLHRLRMSAESIALGNYNQRVEFNSNDEIGLLKETFNKMIEEIKRRDRLLENERSISIYKEIQSQENERLRLSRELHDGLGQSLIAIKLKLEYIEDPLPQSIDNQIKNIKHDLNKIIDEIRQITNDLIPSVLDNYGFSAALSELIEKLNFLPNVEIEFSNIGYLTPKNKNINLALFRIAQEAINNSIKHSGTKKIIINLFVNNEEVILEIKDYGKGILFEDNRISSGHGIKNMKYRAESIGGNFQIGLNSDGGTTVEVRINML